MTARRSLFISGFVLLVVVALTASTPEVPRSTVDGPPLALHAPHHSEVLLPPSLSSGDRAKEEAPPQAPGGRAVAHHASGTRIRSRAVTRRAPQAALYMTGIDAFEPTMGIDKDGTMFTVGFQFDYAPTPDGMPVETTAEFPVLRSDDRGKTWQEISPMIGPQRRHAANGLDPMLHVDEDTGRVFTADLQLLACSTISFSDDKGDSWTTSEACGLTDHQNVFTGPPVSSPTVGYPNVVYYCAMDGGALNGFSTMTSCLKSLDGGITWARTGEPAYTDDPRQEGGMLGIPGHCGGATGHGVTDDKGTVYLPRGYCGQPYLAISKDEGRTWERVQVADNGMPRDPDGPVNEHEAGVAVDARGNIYYTWTARNRLMYLATSTDGGETWSEPMMVGAPGTKETWGPTIAVGAPGKVALAYIGSTNAPGGEAPTGRGGAYTHVTWDGYITMTEAALAKDPVFFSGTVNDPSDPLEIGPCGIVRCQHQYDFIDVVIAPDGTPWTSMVDGYSKDGKPHEINPAFPIGRGVIGGLVGGPPLR